VHLWRGAEVHVSADDESLQTAFDRALDRARRATLRLIARQQERRRPDLGPMVARSPA
jgi:ribosome-associated translation inhibitor RaiA